MNDRNLNCFSPLFLPFLFLSPLLSLRQGFVPSYKSQYPLVSAARRKERRKVAVAEWNMKIFASAKYRLLFTRPTSLCLYAPPRAKLCSFLYFLVGFHENIQRSMIVSTRSSGTRRWKPKGVLETVNHRQSACGQLAKGKGNRGVRAIINVRESYNSSY